MSKELDTIMLELITRLEGFMRQEGFMKKSKLSISRKVGDFKQELNIQTKKLRGRDEGYIQLYPCIRFDLLAQISALIRGEVYRKGWPIVAGNIGNLQEDMVFLEWHLDLSTDTEGLATILYSCIHEIAMPFWEEFKDLDALVRGYEKKDIRLVFNDTNHHSTLIAGYCLQGRFEQAQQALSSWKIRRPQEEVLQATFEKINDWKQNGMGILKERRK